MSFDYGDAQPQQNNRCKKGRHTSITRMFQAFTDLLQQLLKCPKLYDQSQQEGVYESQDASYLLNRADVLCRL